MFGVDLNPVSSPTRGYDLFNKFPCLKIKPVFW
jgi:hypothetical protein